MEYYQPPCLFRQNAIRRVSSDEESTYTNSSTYSDKSPFSYQASNNSSSWLLQQNLAQDTLVMNQACALDRVNIKSNYWKIPDADMNLTALALNDSASNTPLLAISSANRKNNLFIHELDTLNNYLTHHTTISLPNIHGLAWVPNTNSRFLVSGNNKGYAHLVSVPRPSQYSEEGLDNTDESAEIIKRFNHRKHLKSVNKESSIFSHASTCISELGFLSSGQLVTCYDDTLFIWNMNEVESAMRPRPASISLVSGIRSFDTPTENSTTLALCGAFGVSLFDTRTAHHSVPKSSLSQRNWQQGLTNKVKWHPSDEHVLASSHADGVVRLWDIRKNDTFAEMTGHAGKAVTSMSWNGNDLFTGASDGNIVHWDLTSGLDSATEISGHGDRISKCSLKEGINSVSFDAASNSIVERVNERQCGTALPASNNKIVSICPVTGSGPNESCSVLSIDGAAFLGLHSKIYEAANSTQAASEKVYYTKEDLSLIRQEVSSETLLGSSESLVRPLSVIKNTPHFASEETLETLQEEYLGKSEEVSKQETERPERKENILTMEALIDEVTTLSDEVSLVGTEDFEFIQHDYFNKWQNPSDVVSLHSVESSPEPEISPYSSGMSNNDSTASLSTVATLIGPADHSMPKDSSFRFLDLELERICDEFPSHF